MTGLVHISLTIEQAYSVNGAINHRLEETTRKRDENILRRAHTKLWAGIDRAEKRGASCSRK